MDLPDTRVGTLQNQGLLICEHQASCDRVAPVVIGCDFDILSC